MYKKLRVLLSVGMVVCLTLTGCGNDETHTEKTTTTEVENAETTTEETEENTPDQVVVTNTEEVKKKVTVFEELIPDTEVDIEVVEAEVFYPALVIFVVKEVLDLIRLKITQRFADTVRSQ